MGTKISWHLHGLGVQSPRGVNRLSSGGGAPMPYDQIVVALQPERAEFCKISVCKNVFNLQVTDFVVAHNIFLAHDFEFSICILLHA